MGRIPRQPMMPLPHLTLREVCTHTLTVASEAVEAEALSTKGGFRNTPWSDRRGYVSAHCCRLLVQKQCCLRALVADGSIATILVLCVSHFIP